MPDFAISLLHATARTKPTSVWPHGWKDAMRAFLDRAADPKRVEYVLSLHESRYTELLDHITAEDEAHMARFGAFLIRRNRGRDCEVDNVNNAASHATGRILMGIQDDLFPPERWDEAIIEAFRIPVQYDDNTGEPFYNATSRRPLVLGFSTGSQHDGECSVTGACTRAFYMHRGFLLHPDYESIGADNELTEQAKRDSFFLACPQIQFEHRSPSISKGEPDEIWRKYRTRRDWRLGAAILERRRAAGFPRESIFFPGEKLEMPPHIALCLPGRMFHGAWVFHVLALYGNLLQHGWDVDLHPFYCSNVYSTRQAIADHVLTTEAELLLWIDEDNLLTWDQFQMLKQDLDTHPEIDAVAAWCWCGTDVYESTTPPFVSCGPWGNPYQNLSFAPKQMLGQELLPVGWTGFPTVLMRRACLEKVGPKPFAPILSNDIAGGFTGEDISFCHHATERGVQIAVDPRVHIPHLKFRPLVPFAVALQHEVAQQKAQHLLDRLAQEGKEGAAAAPCDQPAAAEAAA